MKDQVDWVPDERLIAEIAAVPEMVRLLKSACRAAEIAGHRDLEEKIWNLLIAVGAISVITNQAEEKALDEAGNHLFTEHHSEYESQD